MNSLPVAAMPKVSDRVRTLFNQMTLPEKLAQLVGYWVDQGGNVVAPMQNEMATSTGGPQELARTTQHGLGHYTRVYGTRPVDPAARAAWLWSEQRRLIANTRLGIPAIVHEEVLTGVAAWQATTFPTPLAWGAAFNPELVAQMGELIGESMRELGVHQGLAPVLDVIRDPRWGRVEECIAEDPYVVGTIGTAYVQGLQKTGIHATLKHFVGYSGSRAGRNHAPVSAGPRELADTYLPPFEMAIRVGKVASVMNSYTDIDGVPVGANPQLLTELLRGEYGFTGTVVADYFSVAFLAKMHGLTADLGLAAQLALQAGIDVELPTGDAYLEPLARRVEAGQIDPGFIERSVLRVLAQKEALGLLDPDAYAADPPTHIDLDPASHRQLAYQLAGESIILLANDGVLPLAATPAHKGATLSHANAAPRRIAVLGPNADSATALQGCYSFANHVLVHYPDVDPGIQVPTVYEALVGLTQPGKALAGAEVCYARGCHINDGGDEQIAQAVALAKESDVAVVVVGDQAGLFGRGTVGEGNDVESLELPGAQRRLLTEVIATGTPVVAVVISGRPYALDWLVDAPAGKRANAVVQAFFPGQAGGSALAAVLAGDINPSGRLPVTLPRSAGAQPYTYLHPILGGPSDVTSADPTPVRPFGFGLSYTQFSYSQPHIASEFGEDGLQATITVANTGARPGAEVVQLYGRDLEASVVRPVAQLLAYTKVHLAPGEAATITFTVPLRQFSFTDYSLTRVVEPGEFEVWFGRHAPMPTRPSSTGGIVAVGGEENAGYQEVELMPRQRTVYVGPHRPIASNDDFLVTAQVTAQT